MLFHSLNLQFLKKGFLNERICFIGLKVIFVHLIRNWFDISKPVEIGFLSLELCLLRKCCEKFIKAASNGNVGSCSRFSFVISHFATDK